MQNQNKIQLNHRKVTHCLVLQSTDKSGEFKNKIEKEGGTLSRIYGQEKNVTTYNLARMNMLLHGVKDSEFEIFHPDLNQM